MLLLYFHTRASLGENYILEEPLGPSLGIQAQLPVLLGEYAFHSTRDLSDYLKLLSTIRPYFHSILQFEEKKSQAGLFMSDATLDRILTQCRSFIRDPNSNYMDELFAQRLKTFGKLTEKEQNHLLTFHHQLITKQVIPAYQELNRRVGEAAGYRQDQPWAGILPRWQRILPVSSAYPDRLLCSRKADPETAL